MDLLLLVARYIRPHSPTLLEFHYRGRLEGQDITSVILNRTGMDEYTIRMLRNHNYMISIDNAEVNNMILTGTITKIQEV